ncbi:MAG: hypothetical protein J0H67_19610 [Rhodospirillales bacterium]|nr:hypothetical protein [Rhodospirillales bacterium]
MNERQFPRDLRALFDLFRFYRPELGLQALLMDVDLTGLTATDVYRACHGRVPETPEMASAHERMGIRRLFEVALRSREFRTLFVPRFIAAYPEKRCLSFIHVPKSAGSDLSAHLITRFPSLRTTIIDPDLGSEAAFFAAVKDIVLESAVSEHVYIHGHNTLETYARWGAARPQDHLFTTIREPISLLVSQVNYVLTRMASPETPMAPDTAGWRSIFGVDDPARLEDRGEVLRLAATILRDQGVVPADNTCRFLGDGTAEGAIAAMVRHDVEITDLRRYPLWSQQRWAVRDTSTRANASRPYVRLEDFSPEDRSHMHAITAQDQVLHAYVARRLDATGQASLRGAALRDRPAAAEMALARGA